jgi:hypothetical protein
VPPGFPGAGGETGVSIYAFGQSKLIAHLKDADPLAGRLPDPFSLARVSEQVFLIPRARALIVLQARELRVRVLPVELEAEMARSGVKVPWVTSEPPRTFKVGTPLRYRMEVKSTAGGLKFKLEEPGAGLDVSADGVLTYKAPADAPSEVRATIRVMDANGGTSLHSFPLTRVD